MTTRARQLEAFSVPSEPGGERDVIRRLSDVVEPLGLNRDELDRLRTAVAETVMNSIEHGNHNDPNLLVDIVIRYDEETVEVLVSDKGGLRELPDRPEIPDLQAKLDGLQRPRGWGLFLVRSMVDAMDVVADPQDPTRHTARLRMRVSGPEPRPTQPEESQHAQM
jgi:anti-sigma regulatory factor (Ser/Thr protein kinase)